MEGAAGVAAGCGGSVPMHSSSSSSSVSQSSRKEWRAVSEHSVRNADNEQGRGPLDVDFISIAVNGSLMESELSQQQRLHDISRKREELQQMEIELQAQFIARSELMAMQNNFDAQIREHVNDASKLKEKLQEREQTVRQLELKMEEKDRELRAVKNDNEAAWAKEGLLREQNKELASFRRERDNSEAERGQHLQQIHDLKEHIQEKERQFLELEEQHRVAQETILYKDGQLREAQAWITRVQEMDALQSTTNHSLQAELQDRTQQFNHFWLGCQRQFAEMERHHMQAVQQLQVELTEARERGGIYTDESCMVRANTKEASSFAQNQESHFSLSESAALGGNSGAMSNENVDDFPPFASTANSSTKADEDQVAGVSVVPSPLFGISAFPPGQVPALHPFVLHQQAVPSSVPSSNVHILQSHLGHFQSMPIISSNPQWQNQQAVSEHSKISSQNQYLLSQTEENLLGSGVRYDYDLSNGHILQPDHLDNVSSNQELGSVVTTSNEESQVLQSNDKINLVPHQPQQNFQQSAQFHAALRLDSPERNSETKVQDEKEITATNHSLEGQELSVSIANVPVSDVRTVPVNPGEARECNSSVQVSSEASGRTTNLLSTKQIPETTLLDERSLLACIVRAIPAGSGGRIRISSTLPNRLGKMLAPLHWHDYKKKYGKLDEFVAGHPKLFVIDGDFIHLREGAQEIISATAAVAKVAAAVAAASAPYSSLLPSVAVTPMAQFHRLKKVPSDPKPVKTGSTKTSGAAPDSGDKPSHNSAVQNQESNGASFNVVNGLSDVKNLSKPKDAWELNGMQSEIRPDHSAVHMTVGNGAYSNRAGLQTKGSNNGVNGMNFAGKQPERVIGAALTSRR